MFPSIFWSQNSNDGSIVGGLPLSLWASSSETKKLGFAGIREHIQTRLINPTLLCGSDSRYVFFNHDILSNIQLGHVDTRLMTLSQGYEDLVKQGVVIDQGLGMDDEAVPGEGRNDKRMTRMLASLTREAGFNYFLTFTCNQSQHFGVAPIHNWTEERCKEAERDPDMSESDIKERCQGYRHASQVLLLREWMDVGEDFMGWIIHSPEQPVGEIDRNFWKWEFQDDIGGLPHIHCLLTLVHPPTISDETFEKQLFDRIVCSSRMIASMDVTMNLVDLGVLEPDEYDEFVSDFSRIQTHSCLGRHLLVRFLCECGFASSSLQRIQ